MSVRVVARISVLFVILNHCLLCFAPPAVAPPASNPSAGSDSSMREYAESVSTLKGVDFKNRSYSLDCTEVLVIRTVGREVYIERFPCRGLGMCIAHTGY